MEKPGVQFNESGNNCKHVLAVLSGICIVLFVIYCLVVWHLTELRETKLAGDKGSKGQFNGERALHDVIHQVSFGARTPGSLAHQQIANWIIDELQNANWQTELQEISYKSHPIRNVIAHRGNGTPWIILGAHYDSRMVADRDPDLSRRSQPVPGANDGASGVAVLLEIARNLPYHMDESAGADALCWPQVWLVFFDAEDQGGISGWDWIMGSRAFLESLEAYPQATIIIDMVGDRDLNLHIEANSDPELSRNIWAVADASGFSSFLPQVRHRILDDHIPFVEVGIPAVDIIDFDYPYWHTVQDTPDKVSPESMQQVGETLLIWLTECSGK